MEEQLREEEEKERQMMAGSSNNVGVNNGRNSENVENQESVNQYYNPSLMQPSGYSISTNSLQRAPAALNEDMQAKIAENRRKALERRKQREQQQMET